MRSVLRVGLLFFCCAALPLLADPLPLTIVLEAERPVPAEVLRELRLETARLLGVAGIEAEIRPRSEIRLGVNLEHLVLARLKGDCRFVPAAVRPAEGPALAYTHVTDGQIQPFATVLCEHVNAAIRPAMWGSDFRRGGELMGRAVARVLAHELFHILGKEHEHGSAGVFKNALSGRELIAETLDFHPREIRRLREFGRPEPAAAPGAERAAARD